MLNTVICHKHTSFYVWSEADRSSGLVSNEPVHKSSLDRSGLMFGLMQTCLQVWCEADLSIGLVCSRLVNRSAVVLKKQIRSSLPTTNLTCLSAYNFSSKLVKKSTSLIQVNFCTG